MRVGIRSCATLVASSLVAASLVAQEEARIDYLTFAHGAIAVSVGEEAQGRRVGLDKALAAIDGHPAKYSLANKLATAAARTEFVYELPALTTFDRFAVTDVLETPSPSQTFVSRVEVLGSSESAVDGFEPLASGELSPHPKRGEVTELVVAATRPVRWVKLVLSGGLDRQREEFFQDFSEIIGNGSQEPVPLDERFTGIWKYRANVLELKQDRAVVTGCYDANGELQGTVSGNVLRATGADRDTGVASVFVMMVAPEGGIRGVRSTNGAPFANYALEIAPDGTLTDCSEREAAQLGCGSTVHGINFDFDSADIRPDSEPVLASLFEGLESASGVTIVIEGHTSSEGTEAYNQGLSERRAAAVVDELVRRGIPRERIRAAGKGESEPIAPNDDEAGRSINRRVEVECAEVNG